MLNRNTYALLVAMPMLLLATTEGFAWTKTFSGTRDQVRSACGKSGGELIEGGTSTTCLGKSTGVSCDDSGKCVGSGPGPQPRTVTGSTDIVGTLLFKKTFRRSETPQSLVAGSSDSDAAPASPEPQPQPDGEIIN
jgi:hypothetical protein